MKCARLVDGELCSRVFKREGKRSVGVIELVAGVQGAPRDQKRPRAIGVDNLWSDLPPPVGTSRIDIAWSDACHQLYAVTWMPQGGSPNATPYSAASIARVRDVTVCDRHHRGVVR